MRLRTRFGGIAFLLFIAIFFDFREMEFKWDMLSGVCEEVYTYEGKESNTNQLTKTLNENLSPAYESVAGKFSCGEGSISIPIPKVSLFFDPPTILLIWGITFLVVYSRKGNRIEMWEEASHVAKDVGELGAAIGAITVFWGQFSERSMSIGFGVCFISYFVGQATALFLKTYAQHLKRKKQHMEEATNQESVSAS